MIEKPAETRSIRPASEREVRVAPESGRPAGLSFPIYAMQLVLAYEWILSGIDKVADPAFGAQLPAVLHGSTLVNPYGWYSGFLKTAVLTHAALLAPAVEAGEIAIGIALIASGALWLWRPHSQLTLYAAYLACLALAGGVFLSANYSFQQGAPLPGINSTQVLSPGTDIDMMIALLSLSLLGANLWVIKRQRRA